MNDATTPTTFISLSAAARDPRLARDGKHVSPSTMFRLTRKGATAADGSRVKLGTVKTRFGLATTDALIEQFIDRIANPLATVPPEQRRFPSRLASAAILDAAGI